MTVTVDVYSHIPSKVFCMFHVLKVFEMHWKSQDVCRIEDTFTWLLLAFFLIEHFIPISPQEQTQIHQSASPNRLRSQHAVGLGPMSALSVMRIWWTRSSTPVDTCVCATPAASNSRRCPTPAAPSAEGRSKTLSRPTGVRRGTDGQTDSLGTAESQSPGKKRLCSGNTNSGTLN